MASPLPLPSVAPNFKGTCGFGLRGRKSRFCASIRKGLRVSAGDMMIEEDDLLLTFLKDRELNGDFIAKVTDRLWMRKMIKISNIEPDLKIDANQLNEPFVDENSGGFLKLTTTNEWLLGDTTAPTNQKMRAKEQRDDSKRRTRLNLLQYEAIKRELFLLTIAIGTACSGYCLFTFSIQAAVSYATGVLFSCLYLQLLYRYVDNLSRESIPQIFRQKKIKRIGIRSDDLADTFEKVVKGCSMVLSSPRLVIPAAIYGLWGISQHFANDFFQWSLWLISVTRLVPVAKGKLRNWSLQNRQSLMAEGSNAYHRDQIRTLFKLTPAMVGVFAYKAAALVQVYRDNEDLQLILPGSDEDY